uniref:Ubiquitin-like protease family profile domain-containing protein n=1 Tax=Brassica oleracea var. oleracea TaxID=109376 RepID=A0A0D3APP6_BRAOL
MNLSDSLFHGEQDGDCVFAVVFSPVKSTTTTAATDMELELPKRLYAVGLEPQVKKINNCCRMELIRDLKKAMSGEYNDVKIDHVFKHIMVIADNKLGFSRKLVDSFLCKQLITSKMHEKWFVFARTPLRFSLQEYHVVTGLKVSRESSNDVVTWKYDGGITLKSIRKVRLKEVHKWTRIDRMRLIYLCVIMGVVMGRDEKVNIPDMYIKLVIDLDKLWKFHWGLHSYDFLLSSIEKARKKLGKKDIYIFEGFSYAFQIWIMEAIPDFGEICGRQVSGSFVDPRCGNWKGVANVSYEDIIELEDSLTKKGDLFSVISETGNGDMFLHVDYTRKGEMEDERVDLLLDRIRQKFDWSNTEWPDGKKIATETNDFDFGLSTQDLRDLSQDTFVEGFDLWQVKVETSRKSRPLTMSPLQLHDEQIDRTKEDSPDAALVFFREEDWEKVRTWSTSSTRLRIGPATLDFDIANRLMDKSEWVDSLEIDAAMYVFRERTSLKRWRPNRVAFMIVVFSNMIKKEYGLLEGQGRKNYTLHNLLLQYGKGVLPPHCRTQEIWNVDVDRLYVHVHVSGNHWIALCISFLTRSIDVFDCSGSKRYKELDGFANLILRIVKAVQPTRHQKNFAVGAYTVSYVPVGNLNKSACGCGVYSVEFIECHALGLELSLLNDDNIIEARHRVLWDLWEAANDPDLIDRMSKY